jgi:hypothetical protein
MGATYVILCNGNAARWGGGVPEQKWMAPVDGRPNVFRTVDMLLHAGVPADRIVCASRHGHAGFVGDSCRFLALPETGSTCETILLAWREIAGEKVFLLGDVIYTRAAIEIIVTDNAPVRFYGRPGASRFSSKEWGEIFALRLAESGWSGLSSLFEELARKLNRGEIGRAILWDVYFRLVACDGQRLKISRSLFAIIDDQTDDYDDRNEYRRLLACHEAFQQVSFLPRIRHLWLPGLRYRLRRFRHFVKERIGLRARTFVHMD